MSRNRTGGAQDVGGGVPFVHRNHALAKLRLRNPMQRSRTLGAKTCGDLRDGAGRRVEILFRQGLYGNFPRWWYIRQAALQVAFPETEDGRVLTQAFGGYSRRHDGT